MIISGFSRLTESLKGQRLVSIFALLLTSMACNTLQIPPEEQARLDKWVVMEKGPCLPQCPEYQFTVFENGFSTYNGKAHAARSGLFFRYLTQEEMETIEEGFTGIPFQNFQDNYFSQIPDRPTVGITYFYPDGNVKRVVGRENRPEEILELERKLSRIADSGEWSPYERQGVYGKKPPSAKAALPREMIVQLRPEVNIDEWLEKYFDVSMKLVKKIAPKTQYFLVSFDPDSTPPPELLRDVRSDPEVIGAQFNEKTAAPRN
jgi:hypothetical protein